MPSVLDDGDRIRQPKIFPRERFCGMIRKKTIHDCLPYGVWAFFAVFCLRYAMEIKAGGNGWKTGDWLINYSAGPVRWGLTGALLLHVSDLGIPLLWAAYFFQVAIYATVFVLVLKLYKHVERGPFWLLILFSPAFLLFPFYDTQGGFRKEIIVFAAFAFLCVLHAHRTLTHSKLISASIMYGFAAFSHELAVFTLPFFIYLIYISSKNGIITPEKAATYSLLFTAISASALLFAFLFKGDATLADSVCSSLTGRGLDPNICNGAINWLGEDARNARGRVLDSFGYKSIYTPFLLVLSLLPLFFTTWWRKETGLLLVVSMAAITPLFLVAVDWGRWVYISAFMLLCLALAEKVSVKLPRKNVFFILGIIYLTTWSIPYCCVGGIGKGFVGVVHELLDKGNRYIELAPGSRRIMNLDTG